jgi:dienelactone hydrolase
VTGVRVRTVCLARVARCVNDVCAAGRVLAYSILVISCGGSAATSPSAGSPPSGGPVSPLPPTPPVPPNLAFLACGGVSAPAEVQVSLNVPFPRATGGVVDLYAPKSGTQTAACPVIVVLPAGCSIKQDVTWVGPLLASQGYVVMVVSAVIQSDQNDTVCAGIASSALTFMASSANPYRAETDTARAGGIGYSQAARVLVRVQNADVRFKAIVAWDNLTKSDLPDQGSPSCANDPGTTVTPRAPALGLASEQCDVSVLGPEAKKTGYSAWRASGMPAMEVVLAGADHGTFATGSGKASLFIAHYTRQWFDRWLKGDPTATTRLLEPIVDLGLGGEPTSRAALLSSVWRSALFLDGHDCPDLRTSCP